MATKKRGILTAAPQWWKHLRWCKRQFWKQERRNARAETRAGVTGHPRRWSALRVVVGCRRTSSQQTRDGVTQRWVMLIE
ncbi:MAG: hypothetical protein ABSC95_15745 [Acetobacteraceae bacterium]|jgi:hypothetical protein